MTDKLTLAPIPKNLTHGHGLYNLSGNLYTKLDTKDPQSLIPAANQTGLNWEITTSPETQREQIGLIIRMDDSSDIPAEGYALEITPNGIEIIASAPAGAFYGACTLAQIIMQSDNALPCVSISDWPDYPNRGIMLDISRDKAPTMETLYLLADNLASWKINQLQLYTEHTFAYPAHPTVWKNASPMTGEQIMQLDAYCKTKFIKLVPNQNSFGHMERWLMHDEYRQMAEMPDGGETAWGFRAIPTGLCPIDEKSVPFLAGLYDELLPHFSSKPFNVGLDETIDLGYGRSKSICEELGTGRVYLDFLLKVYTLTKERGRKMMFWGDIIMKHPELIPELPKDIIALEWGYEYDHPFAGHGSKFRESGIAFYVCPGASNWNTFAGRTRNAIGNITSAARSGLENGAIGLLNTSWGDNGHWDPLPVAYTGFMAGAMASWNAQADVTDTLADALSLHAFGDRTGKIGKAFYDLGNIYLCFTKRTFNNTIPWQMLFGKLNNTKLIEGITLKEFEEMDCKLEEIAESLKGDQMTAPDADTVRSELNFIINILRLSSEVGKMRLSGKISADLSNKIDTIKQEHRRIWLLRNRPGGLEDSVGRIVTLQ
ncbi:MAG: family 20 glycosylhydrolase [Armatimonadetes bacterium]|nr:family 20 glycosylhydrolase [Armatimonadota bacterium]